MAFLALSSAACAATPKTPAAADSARVSAALTPDGGRIVVEAEGVRPEVPLFFSATADQTVGFGGAGVEAEIRLKLRIVQGRPEVLTLGLSGDGEVTTVTGAGLRDWAVRTGADGKRHLDLRPDLQEGTAGPKELEVVIRAALRNPDVPGSIAVPMIVPGDAVGFASKVVLRPGPAVDVRVTAAEGMVPLTAGWPAGPDRVAEFFSTGAGRIEVLLTRRGAALGDAELMGAQLTGRVNEPARSVDFRLRGQVRVLKAGARLRVLSGRAALSDKAAGDGWHVELVPPASGDEEGIACEIVFDREGTLPLELAFAAAVVEDGDWRRLDFRMPAGAVVPLRLEGLAEGVEFDPDGAVVPAATAQGIQGFLPADGAASLAWRRTREEGEGALFFTSFEQAEVRVGAGLLHQASHIGFRVLQGRLADVRLRLEGPGEILEVEGANVVGWHVAAAAAAGAARMLEVRLSRPFETEGALVVRSQAALGGFPVRAEPVRLTPEGAVRHSGFVRVANSGAVRLEIADVTGMMQLAPAQYPGGALEHGARQVFVYRFPSAAYAYRIMASQIMPEVGVSQIVTYELAETDRVIDADLELDIREAPLRDWSLRIPEDFAVVAVNGNAVADYVAETEAGDGYRTLKLVFRGAVDGRQLVRLRLEKNQPAAAGRWRLAPLLYPEARTVRGHVGVVSVPGYRIAPAATERLVEVPLSFFPKQVPGLQQAWRLREAGWTAAVSIEALGQSVQADVFHLYSLKEGVVYGSVLLNYFVVGAPANEWRIEVPETVGNIDIVGQNVRRDWRREGGTVIVSLHQPVLGAATLLVTFEQPMSARGGTIRPGEVRPVGVQAERGFIQVVSPLQVKHDIRAAEGGLLELEPLELPTEFRLLSTSPSLAVYQYTARPFALELGVEWYEQGETIDQMVDFAKLSSRVSRDGQVVTDARFFVKTRGRQALRMILPKGGRLWEARVDGGIVNARADGDQTLVPLPARMNPNEPVEVSLRLGQPAGRSASSVELTAPAMLVPTVINEWSLRGDNGRLLVPDGGSAELVAPSLTQTGFEWISRSTRGPLAVLLAMIALGGFLLRARSGWRAPAGYVVLAAAAFFAFVLAVESVAFRRVNLDELTYAAAVVPSGTAVTIQVDNVAVWRALVSGWGVAGFALGLGLVGLAFWRHRRHEPHVATLAAAGVALIAAGTLAQRGGATPFFLGLSTAVIAVMVGFAIGRWRKRKGGGEAGGETSGADPAATGGVAPVVPMLALTALLGLGFGGTPDLRADEAAGGWLAGGKAAQAIVQTWTIEDERLQAEIELTVHGRPGDSFLLLRAPAVLTEFRGDGLHVGKVEGEDGAAYFVAPEREGVLTARARFEMAVPDLARGIALPTGPAAVQRVAVQLDQGGWEFASPAAVQVVPTPGLGVDRSGATLALRPGGAAVINLLPQRRDVAAETTLFFAEVANLYLPGPGVVNGYARVTVRPAQGRVAELEMDVPAGYTVGDVARGPVGAWRFDPVRRRLHVAVEPAQTGAFRFDVETQHGTEALPVELALEPLRVLGAAGEVGMLGLAFGGDAQPEGVQAAGLSPVNIEDFDDGLIPRSRDDQPVAVLQQVWRYGRETARLDLKAAPVAPEVRVAGRSVISLGDDRLVMAVDLNVAITRVGVFKLSLALPAGLEVEALSGPALSHWTEADESGERIVTLHLNGRTIGDQAFNLTLAGAAPAAQDSWPVPRVLLREATRQTGELLLVPEKGIRLRAVGRENVSQLDPRSVGGLQPGTLAFRLLQQEWSLRLGIETLDPWVTVQGLQEVTAREGQTLTRIGLRYRVENAAVKQLRVRLPGLDEAEARTVRGSGSAVSDFVRAGGGDEWEVRFQRGVAGETDVQIEFQGQATREEGREVVSPIELVDVRQAALFVAVRGGGRLELEAGDLPRGWQRVDWSAVPADLQDAADRSVPAMCFRLAEPEAALAVAVRRHEVADALELRVTQGVLTTVFSSDGAYLTAVELTVDVAEKSTLRVRLPKGARLYNTFVNGESVTVVREGDAHLFHVAPNSESDPTAAVRLVYAVTEPRDGIRLAGPSLNVPLENVTWRVVIPPGYALDEAAGDLRPSARRELGAYGVEQYQSLVVSKISADAQKATALLEEANSLLQRGDQQQASEVLSRASNTIGLDEASNEDARVQLRALKTQQAVLGLNTRRQKLYLDNRLDAVANAQLEQAASRNPFMQGMSNFDPQQVDQLLMGNTVEENTALRGIAARLVDQQLAAEPAPRAIDVTVPERGSVVTFTRSLQVDGDAPLEMTLDIAKAGEARASFVLLVLLAIGLIAGTAFPRRSHAS